MNSTALEPDNFLSLSQKHSIRIILWAFTWATSMVVVDKAHLYNWWSSSTLSLIAIAVCSLLGVGLVFSYIRYLRCMDDLQRKIQLDALAVALGVTMVGCVTYSLLVTWKFIVDVDVTDILLLMMCTYMISVVAGMVRYR